MSRTILRSALVLALAGCGPRPHANLPSDDALQPSAPPSATAPAPADYSALPKPSEPPVWALPSATTWTLGNGMKVYYLRQGATPLVSLLLVLPRGAATDPKGKMGLTALTTDLLDEGAGGKDALALNQELQRLGTDYGASTDVDQVVLYMNSIAENFSASAKILSDIVRRPTLSQAEFSRRRDQRVAEEISAESEPGHGRAVALRRSLFADGYGSWLPTGTKQSLKKLSLADVKHQYTALFVPEGAALVVVGGVDDAPVRTALGQAFGDWSGKATTSEAAVDEKAPAPVVALVDYPGTTQSSIGVARRAGPESSPEYFPAMVFSRAFGEAFTSRVNLNLREDKGYTYGSRSTFNRWAKTGFFATVANVKKETTRPSIDEVLKELSAVCGSRALSQSERDDAVNGLLLGFPGRFERNSDVAGQLASLPVYGRQDDWFERWPERVRAVDAAQANAVAKQYCDKKDYVIVIAGDRASVEPTLDGLDLAVVRYDSSGNRLK